LGRPPGRPAGLRDTEDTRFPQVCAGRATCRYFWLYDPEEVRLDTHAMDVDTAKSLAGVVRLLRQAAVLAWAATDRAGAGSQGSLFSANDSPPSTMPALACNACCARQPTSTVLFPPMRSGGASSGWRRGIDRRHQRRLGGESRRPRSRGCSILIRFRSPELAGLPNSFCVKVTTRGTDTTLWK
jgi:hypothetical protein